MSNFLKTRFLSTLLLSATFTGPIVYAGRCDAIERKIAENMEKLKKEVEAFQKMAKEHKENVQRLLDAEKKYKK